MFNVCYTFSIKTNEHCMEPSTSQTSPAVPIAIICGFALIALAIFFTNNSDTPAPVAQQPVDDAVAAKSIRPIDGTDYIRGNPNAPILMVEYSDYDCPFCKQFHNTMKIIMDEYGITGQVAWVYRQFPITELHPNSAKIAETALCVGKTGGQKAFLGFTDLIYEERGRDVTELTNVTKLPDYVAQVGISLPEYEACLAGGDMTPVLEESIRDAYDLGARGTPYTVLIVGNQQAIINGAQSYETVKGIISNLIDQLEGNYDVTNAPESVVPINDAGLPVID